MHGLSRWASRFIPRIFPRYSSWLAPLAALLLASCGGSGTASSLFRVDGAVDKPASYSTYDLLAFPAVTQTVTFNSGSTPQTHTYTGPSLWALLNTAGLQNDATRKNDVLNRYVLATGADGYKAVFALGELSPDFGNKPSVVAYGEVVNGAVQPFTGADAPARVTAPGDVKGGRYVSALARLEVRSSGSTVAGTAAGGVSTQFAVTGAVNQTRTFDLSALQSLPVTTQTVAGSLYTGVSLWTLLNSALGIKVDATLKNPTLGMYAVATGSDGYKALVSLGEIDPGFGNKTALIAYSVDGAPLNANGVARLVVPGEVKQGRSVSNLVRIEVFAAP